MLEQPVFEIDEAAVRADFDRLMWSSQLRDVTRFLGQRYWENESLQELQRRKSFGTFRLENVAEHCWHLSDAVIVIGPRYKELDIGKAAILASVHDLLEIDTGDFDPIGNGSGLETHAFSNVKSREKLLAEEMALNRIREKFKNCTNFQFDAIMDYLLLESIEARFVKALDKIQVLMLVYEYKQSSGIESEHMKFANKYCGAQVDMHFSKLRPYLDYMLDLIDRIPTPIRKTA